MSRSASEWYGAFMEECEVIDFADALTEANEKHEHVSVLLGNGFSIDYDAGMFDYKSLSAKADLSELGIDRTDLFAQVDSKDFEVAIDYLTTAAGFADLYGVGGGHADCLRKDAEVVRSALAAALASSLHDDTFEMDEDDAAYAREFLSKFDEIFTLNYDPLLYWVVNRTEIDPQVAREDGFRQRGGQLVWAEANEQAVHYLHGALHLFESGRDLEKVRYTRSSSIVETIRRRLGKGRLPLVVTEGRRAQKEARISASDYLRTANRRLGECRGALFIHGVSMSQNDDHIFGQIEFEASGIETLYVSLHGGSGHRSVVKRVEDMVEQRRKVSGKPLRAEFYAAESANVWRESL